MSGLCSYNCGNIANHTLKNGKLCCSPHWNSCPSIKKKNSEGLIKAIQEGRKGYTHNPNSAWSKGKVITPNSEVFVEESSYSTEFLKDRIQKQNLLEYKCSGDDCGISDWKGKKIVLELDHINGINNDNRLVNLRYLCPNCHSQTPTFRGRNKNTGKIKVPDSDLLAAYNQHGNIRKALIAVGLVPKGGNYERMKKILIQNTN